MRIILIETSASSNTRVGIDNSTDSGQGVSTEINSLVPAQAQATLAELVKYYLVNGEGHISGKQELVKQLGLMLVAVSGAGLYVIPSVNYAQREQDNVFWLWNYSVCTATAALVVLYNSTGLFLIMRKAEQIPEKLANYLLDPFTPRQRIRQNIAITLGAAISALPLAAVSFMYPIPGMSKIFIALQAVIVAVDNTLLHFLPIKLALQNPWYRLPTLPLEFIYDSVVNCQLSPVERRANELYEQKNKLYQAIKHYLINNLTRTQQLLSNYGFYFEGISYRNNAGPQIKNLHEEPLQPLDLLIKLIDHFRDRAPLPQNHLYRSVSSTSAVTSWVDKQLKKLSYVLGAVWVTSSCAGYLVAPVNGLGEITHSEVTGAALSIPSIYFLGVLLAFFGGNSLQNTYDYFTSWKDDAVKIPKEFKLYPKTALLLIIISMYLSTFSYAAAAELIEDNFNGSLEFLRPYMLVLAKTGLAFLGFTAMLDFFCNILKKCAQYGSNENSSIVIKLTEAFDQLKNSIMLMKPDLLIESLSILDEQGLKSLFNLTEEKDKEKLVATFEQLARLSDCEGDDTIDLLESTRKLLDTVKKLPIDPENNLVINSDIDFTERTTLLTSNTRGYGAFFTYRQLTRSSFAPASDYFSSVSTESPGNR